MTHASTCPFHLSSCKQGNFNFSNEQTLTDFTISWPCAQLLSILGNADKNSAWWTVFQNQVQMYLRWSESFPKSWIFSCLALSSLYTVLCSRSLKYRCLFSVTPLYLKFLSPGACGKSSIMVMTKAVVTQMQVEPIPGVLSLQEVSARHQTKPLLPTWPDLSGVKELAFSER